MKGSKVLNKAIASAKQQHACPETYKRVLRQRGDGWSWAKVWRGLSSTDKLWFASYCCSVTYYDRVIVITWDSRYIDPFSRPPRAREILERDEA